jgi:UDP-MurNAc hydroxylase
MRLTLVSHASVLIEHGPVALLTDPWLGGEVFNESWSLLAPPAFTADTMPSVSDVWISHEHPDHLHFPTLKALPSTWRARATLLMQRHASPRIAQACGGLGFREVRELALARWIDVGSDVQVYCASVGSIDSLLAVHAGGVTVLNVNDCVLSPRAARALARHVGPVDVLLTQFSIAGWVGNPGDARPPATDEVLNRMAEYVRVFKPRVTIPFASFVYFSHDENRYMNDWINTPGRDLDRLEGVPTKVQFLYHGDRFTMEGGAEVVLDPVVRWEADFAAVPSRPTRSASRHGVDELVKAGRRLVEEVHERLPGVVLRRARPLQFFVEDQGAAILFDLARGQVQPTPAGRDACDIALGSQALWFAFTFAWGFGTLGVSGRYQQLRPQVNRRALYLCHLASSGLHPAGLLTRRAAAYWWSKRREVAGRLLGR